MPPYWTGPSEDEASDRGACVPSAVAAIPTPATRAPRAYEPLAVFKADEQHRPGERRAHLLHLAVLREQRLEADLRPVVHVAGRVTGRLPVAAAGHVHHPPDRLARDRGEQPPVRHARHLREGL